MKKNNEGLVIFIALLLVAITYGILVGFELKLITTFAFHNV